VLRGCGLRLWSLRTLGACFTRNKEAALRGTLGEPHGRDAAGHRRLIPGVW
jgi:hypothetical protein